jgi:predicted site-specific integrase-resolvase
MDRYRATVPARTALDVYQVADLAGVSPATVRQWIAGGKLRTVPVGPRQRQVVPQEVLARFLRTLDENRRTR